MEEQHIQQSARYFEPVTCELTTSMTSSGWWMWHMKFHAKPEEDGTPRLLELSPVYTFFNDHIVPLKSFVRDLADETKKTILWDIFGNGLKVLTCWPNGNIMKIWVSFRNDSYEYGIETDRRVFSEAVIREYERFESELAGQLQHAVDRFDEAGGWYENEPDENGRREWCRREEGQREFL